MFYLKEKKRDERKGIALKGTSMKETKGPMLAADQIENLVKKAKNYTNNIRICAMSDGMRTILQVTKCTGFPHQMSFAKDSSEFVLKRF